jgi:hypothetical protein
MSLILKMNDWLTCKEWFDEACFNSLDEQLVSNLLEDEQDLNVGDVGGRFPSTKNTCYVMIWT